MEGKRYIWSSEAKHRWHLSFRKARRLDKIFARIEKERLIEKAKVKEIA